MVFYESSTHARSILEGFNFLRLSGHSTDLHIVSAEGEDFKIHRLLLKASGVDQHMSHSEKFHVKASALAVKVFIEFLYTGRLDLPDVSYNVVNDLRMLAQDYQVKSLHHTLLCIKQRIIQDSLVSDSCQSLESSKECSQPVAQVNDSGVRKDIIEIRIEQEKTISKVEEAKNDSQQSKQNASTKLLLKKFLHQKAKSDNKKTVDSNPIAASSHVTEESDPPHKTVCCHLCGKLIAKKGFPAHMKVHGNIKDKTCEICGKRFRKACNLQEHWQRIHMAVADKPYTCSRCGACFAIRSDLTRHVSRHDAKTCFVCELCGASFVGKRMWRKHKCMDDIFHSAAADLTTAFGEDTSPASKAKDPNSSHPMEEDEEDILNISTLLPLGFEDDAGANEILSEIDGLFYENQTLNT